MAFFESANQGTPASSPTAKFYKSFCQGSYANNPANGFYESTLVIAANGETYLIQFQVDTTATSFEIMG